jgi:hypothetical protein
MPRAYIEMILSSKPMKRVWLLATSRKHCWPGAGEFGSVVEKTGGLISNQAHSLPSLRVALLDQIPLKDTFNEALSTYL